MKKILSSLIIISLIASFTPSVSAASTVNLNVKISSAGDETYTTSLSNVSQYNTDITFQFTEISAGWAEEYSVSLPTGFVYQSSNTTGTDCAGFSILENTNTNFRFSLNGAANCFAQTEFTYRVTSSATATNQTISLLKKNGTTWNSTTSITVDVTARNAITKALTKDLNGNGFIDAYVLSFATGGIDANALSGVTMAGTTPSTATASGSNWIIPFTDSILNTGDLPQIGGVFDTITLSNPTINEQDGAIPQIMKVNGVNLKTLTGGQSISIGTGAFAMEFSEKMATASTGAFSLKLGTTPVVGNYTFNTTLDKLTFTPSTSLVAGSYTLSSTTGATDWSSNSNAISQAFPTIIVTDVTPPTGASLGAGTGVIINAGNLTTNNSSVQLQFLASDDVGVSDMMVSNDSTFSGASWQSYSTNRLNWNLTTGTGTKTVYAKFKDTVGNISSVYSDTIVYNNILSYINFDTNSSIYTDATSISLSGACNYISSTGAVLGTTITTYVGTTNLGTISCTANRWTQNFTGLTPNSGNTLKVEYVGDTSINSTVLITNPVPSCTAVANGVVSGTYPSCSLTCNSGYTKTGGTCVLTPVTPAPSGGGGGGGGGGSVFPDNCPSGDLSGNRYDNKCAAPTTTSTGVTSTWSTSTGTTSTGSTSTGSSSTDLPSILSIDTLNNSYFTGMADARNYLTTRIQDLRVLKLADTYKNAIILPDESYYMTIDSSLFAEYNRIINAYVILFLRVSDAVLGNRSDAVRSDGRISYGVVTSGVLLAKNFLDRYATSTYLTERGITIYRTKFTVLERPLSILETKVLNKFALLLSSNTITYDEYIQGVQAYNDFVLHLSIYRSISKHPLVKERALAAIKIFTTLYAKKIAPVIEPSIDQTLEQKRQAYLDSLNASSVQKIGAVYTFSRDLKFGETSQDITNLQTILKSYGYFGSLNPTGYFGPSTKGYLIQFSKEILHIDNPNGLFDIKIREAIVQIEAK